MSISFITLLQNNLNFPNILISSKVNCFPFGVCSSLTFVSLYCSSYASFSFKQASNFLKSSRNNEETYKLISIYSCTHIQYLIQYQNICVSMHAECWYYIFEYFHLSVPCGSLFQSASVLSSPMMCILQFAIICSVTFENNDVMRSAVL